MVIQIKWYKRTQHFTNSLKFSWSVVSVLQIRRWIWGSNLWNIEESARSQSNHWLNGNDVIDWLILAANIIYQRKFSNYNRRGFALKRLMDVLVFCSSLYRILLPHSAKSINLWEWNRSSCSWPTSVIMNYKKKSCNLLNVNRYLCYILFLFNVCLENILERISHRIAQNAYKCFFKQLLQRNKWTE